MDKQQILNKTITIQRISTKETKSGQKYSLRDHEGRTFNFFTTKQDGADTSAFSQFKSMGLKMGSTVMIGYVEDEFQMEGKTVISKKIINFTETGDTPSQTAWELTIVLNDEGKDAGRGNWNYQLTTKRKE
jgi:hypothetical protein